MVFVSKVDNRESYKCDSLLLSRPVDLNLLLTQGSELLFAPFHMLMNSLARDRQADHEGDDGNAVLWRQLVVELTWRCGRSEPER